MEFSLFERETVATGPSGLESTERKRAAPFPRLPDERTSVYVLSLFTGQETGSRRQICKAKVGFDNKLTSLPFELSHIASRLCAEEDLRRT